MMAARDASDAWPIKQEQETCHRQKPKQKSSNRPVAKLGCKGASRRVLGGALFAAEIISHHVARNLRLPSGEIDLIAKRGALLIFVEVKYRPNQALAHAAIRPQQWRRIEAAAAQFVAKRPTLQACRWRFDVLAMAPKSWPLHRRNAWRSQY